MARSLPAPLWAVVGVVLGFVVGGVLPRQDLAERDAELARLQDDLVKARRQAARRSPLSVVGLDRAGAPSAASAPQRQADDQPGSQPPRDPAPSPPRDTGAGPQLDVVEVGGGGDPLAEFDLAVDAQRLRIDQSRAALVEQADLDDSQVEALDTAVAEMNDRLSEMGEELLDLVESSGEPDSRALLGVTHDVSGILYDAQVEVDEIIGQDAVETVDPQSREVWNYVDLESFRDTVEAAGGVRGGR